jgi:pimeloyl-ACP methyl ester carboxylesterase
MFIEHYSEYEMAAHILVLPNDDIAASTPLMPEANPAARSPDEYQLEALGGARPTAPRWAAKALAQEPERAYVQVEGASIESLSWGRRSAPGLLLLHGSRASAEWWSFVAPLLATDFRVSAFSMSGMGRSDRRPTYALSQYGREAITVAEATGLFDGPGKPVLVAHSFGGYAALRASRDASDKVAGVVLVDSIIMGLEEPRQKWVAEQPEPRRSYPSQEAAIARFRLIPPRATDSLWALDHIARSSICQDHSAGDWTWQFDPALFARIAHEDNSDLARVTAPVAIIRGEESQLIDPRVRDYVAEVFGDDIPDVVIPDAGHHIMIDQPLALATALRALLAAWPARPLPRRSTLGATRPVEFGEDDAGPRPKPPSL